MDFNNPIVFRFFSLGFSNRAHKKRRQFRVSHWKLYHDANFYRNRWVFEYRTYTASIDTILISIEIQYYKNCISTDLFRVYQIILSHFSLFPYIISLFCIVCCFFAFSFEKFVKIVNVSLSFRISLSILVFVFVCICAWWRSERKGYLFVV